MYIIVFYVLFLFLLFEHNIPHMYILDDLNLAFYWFVGLDHEDLELDEYQFVCDNCASHLKHQVVMLYIHFIQDFFSFHTPNTKRRLIVKNPNPVNAISVLTTCSRKRFACEEIHDFFQCYFVKVALFYFSVKMVHWNRS